MSYKTYFLKFSDESNFDTVSEESGYKLTINEQLDADGNVTIPESISYSTHQSSGPGAVDIIGTIYNDDAVYSETETDEEGLPVLETPATQVDGYHVNICIRSDVQLPEQFSNYILDPAPATPARSFG